MSDQPHDLPRSRSRRRRSRRTPSTTPDQAEDASTIDNFDFERFFEAFPLDSTVSTFIETFSITAFRALMIRAFANVSLLEYSSPEAQDARNARVELEEEFLNIDTALGFMGEAGLDIQSVRNSLDWVRQVNQTALGYDNLERAVRHSPVHAARTGDNRSDLRNSSPPRGQGPTQPRGSSPQRNLPPASGTFNSYFDSSWRYPRHLPASRVFQGPECSTNSPNPSGDNEHISTRVPQHHASSPPPGDEVSPPPGYPVSSPPPGYHGAVPPQPLGQNRSVYAQYSRCSHPASERVSRDGPNGSPPPQTEGRGVAVVDNTPSSL